ncbi:MAG: glycerol-3-phosphate dehydrogenase/oxidase [Chitinophagales bacterium]|nr:glycerol-3-phosphate dehydrogenase/oxidase [Chitinophagales bacterium]
MSRANSIQKVKNETFDVCIIGGGITGAGIATAAVQQGYKTVLIDKNDFASGTSSRSSKMIHGGLRYLKMLQFGLVREALLEREHLLKKYPALVKPLPFIMPSYKSKIELAIVSFVIRFYGKLAGKSSLPKSKKLSSDEVTQHLPGFNKNNLKGGVLYWDGWTNDAMLTIQAIKDAKQNGAVTLNYCEAKKFMVEGETVKSLTCSDKISSEELSISAKVFINASGVWTDDVLNKATGETHKVMKPSKGVHVVVSNKKIASGYVAIIESGTTDKRYLYSFPWEHNLTVLGNTDTEYNGSADKLETTEADVKYILNAFNKSFPNANLSKRDIVSVYAGLRPMLDDESNKGTYSRSREYRIWWSKKNLLNIAGGKLTSFLSMGERCMQAAKEQLLTPENANKTFVQTQTAVTVNDILKEDNSLQRKLFDGLNVTAADIVWHTRHLFAEKVEDVLTRRTAVTYALKNFNEAAVRETASIMAKELKKDEPWINAQLQDYFEHWKEYHPEFLNS